MQFFETKKHEISPLKKGHGIYGVCCQQPAGGHQSKQVENGPRYPMHITVTDR